MRSERRDWRAIAKRALEQRPANRSLTRARPGAVFSLTSDVVTFPEERLDEHPPRTTHPRRVIVVQARAHCTGPDPLTILVVPCTASFRGEPGPWDFRIPDGEPGFTSEGVVALLALLQPVLKIDLRRCEGTIGNPTLLELQSRLAAYLALQSAPAPIELPERAPDKPPPLSAPAPAPDDEPDPT
jgi:hypothetical protein